MEARSKNIAKQARRIGDTLEKLSAKYARRKRNSMIGDLVELVDGKKGHPGWLIRGRAQV